MVRFLLARTHRKIRQLVAGAAVVALLLSPAWAAKQSKETSIHETRPHPVAGGRTQTHMGAQLQPRTRSEAEARLLEQADRHRRGPPDFRYMVNPYSVTTDSRGTHHRDRSGRQRGHIFDFQQQKYKFLTRREKDKDFTADAAMRRRRCARQYLRDRLGGRQDLCLGAERKVQTCHRQPERRRRVISSGRQASRSIRPRSGSTSPTLCVTRSSSSTCKAAC